MSASDGIEIPMSVPGAADVITLLARITNAVEGMGDKTTTAADKTKSATDRINEGLTGAAEKFNRLSEAASTIRDRLGALVEQIVALSTEQTNLDRNSERLHLNFDQAAAAAGRFADETDAMAAANRLAEAGLHLTQREMDSFMRRAGQLSQNMGVDMASAADTLTTALITGSSRAMRQLGPEMEAVAGSTHTATQRLAAMEGQASKTATATDDAASAMARYRDSIDDSHRAMAAAFVDEITKLEQVEVLRGRSAQHASEETSHMRELGQAAAFTVLQIGNVLGVVAGTVATAMQLIYGGIRVAATALNEIAHGRFSNVSAATGAQIREQFGLQSNIQTTADFTADRMRSLLHAGDERTSAAPEAPSADMTFSASDVATDAREARDRNRTAHTGSTSSAAQNATSQAARRAELIRVRQLSTGGELGLIEDVKGVRGMTAESAQMDALYAAANERSRRHGETVAASTDRVTAAIHTYNDARAATLAQETALRTHENARLAAQAAEGQHWVDAQLAQEQATMTARKAREAERINANDIERRAAAAEHARNDPSAQMHDMLKARGEATVKYAESVSQAYDMMGQAAMAHFDAWREGSETGSKAFSGFVHDVLEGLVKIAAVQFISETAAGFAALASENYKGMVAHFIAAGIYASVAGTAAVVSSYTKTDKGGVADAAPRSGAPRSAAAVSGGSGSSGGSGQGNVVNVYFGGPMYGTGGVRQAGRELTNMMNLASVQGGYQLNPSAIGTHG